MGVNVDPWNFVHVRNIQICTRNKVTDCALNIFNALLFYTQPTTVWCFRRYLDSNNIPKSDYVVQILGNFRVLLLATNLLCPMKFFLHYDSMEGQLIICSAVPCLVSQPSNEKINHILECGHILSAKTFAFLTVRYDFFFRIYNSQCVVFFKLK